MSKSLVIWNSFLAALLIATVILLGVIFIRVEDGLQRVRGDISSLEWEISSIESTVDDNNWMLGRLVR